MFKSRKSAKNTKLKLGSIAVNRQLLISPIVTYIIFQRGFSRGAKRGRHSALAFCIIFMPQLLPA